MSDYVSKPVNCYSNKTGEFLKEFDTVGAATREHGDGKGKKNKGVSWSAMSDSVDVYPNVFFEYKLAGHAEEHQEKYDTRRAKIKAAMERQSKEIPMFPDTKDEVYESSLYIADDSPVNKSNWAYLPNSNGRYLFCKTTKELWRTPTQKPAKDWLKLTRQDAAGGAYALYNPSTKKNKHTSITSIMSSIDWSSDQRISVLPPPHMLANVSAHDYIDGHTGGTRTVGVRSEHSSTEPETKLDLVDEPVFKLDLLGEYPIVPDTEEVMTHLFQTPSGIWKYRLTVNSEMVRRGESVSEMSAMELMLDDLQQLVMERPLLNINSELIQRIADYTNMFARFPILFYDKMKPYKAV